MFRRNRSNQINKTSDSKKKVILFVGFFLALFILVQLASLSFFGTKGDEMGYIRKEQERLILENEILKSDINELQSLSRIEKTAKEVYGMKEVGEVVYIRDDNYVSLAPVNE